MSTAIQEIPDLSQYEPSKDSLLKKYILITGATDGIGKALSHACANLGAELLLLGKDEDRLQSLAEELSSTSKIDHEYYALDFSIAGEGDYVKFAEHIAREK